MKKTKLFATLLICTFFLLLVSRSASSFYLNFLEGNKKLPTQTYVASINISSLTKREAVGKIENEIKKWKRSGLAFKYDGKKINSNDIVNFDIKKTVYSINKSGQYPLIIKIEENKVAELITQNTKIKLSDKQRDEVFEECYRVASLLIEKPINLNSFLNSINEQNNVLLNEIKINKGNYNFKPIHKTIVISPNETFSFLNEFNKPNSTNEELQLLARQIYKLSISSPLFIIERKIPNRLSNFEYLGYDVNITKGKNDLKFENRTNNSITIIVKAEKNYISAQIYSSDNNFEYSFVLRNEKKIPRQKIIESDPNLDQGKSEIKTEGYDGYYGEVYREIKSKDGKVTRVELISKDFYAPKNNYVKHGVKKLKSQNEELPPNVSIWGDTDNNK
ncbi:MAG: hypothetical protein K0S34_914 [Bacillales bacterium]|jgi:hypothetical protein|nr:hypothetical protein [Bacillales bacterium]